MLIRRTAYGPLGGLGLVALLGICLVLPSTARAEISAPALQSPAAGASADEGKSVDFSWTGALQGDATSRSFFRVEIASAKGVPADAQAEWSSLTNYRITSPGENINSMAMGMPEAGSYVWRVCAWGVVDASADASLQQLPGGCSESRTLTSTAVASSASGSESGGGTSALTVEGETRRVQPPPIVKVVKRSGSVTTLPAQNRVVRLPQGESQKARIDSAKDEVVFGEDGVGSATHLPADEDLTGSQQDASSGVFGVLTRGLSATLPFVPIPYWSLALLLSAIPLAWLWRRTTLNMFEWPAPDDIFGESLEAIPMGVLKVPPAGADEPLDHLAGAPQRTVA